MAHHSWDRSHEPQLQHGPLKNIITDYICTLNAVKQYEHCLFENNSIFPIHGSLLAIRETKHIKLLMDQIESWLYQ